jgi:hypothetical protein
VISDRGSGDRSRRIKIIGCDFHPGYQQIAVLDLATGEIVEKALSHERKKEVGTFYADCEGPYGP